MVRKLPLAVGLAIVLALLAAACGSDDSSEGTEEELIETVESFYATIYPSRAEADIEEGETRCLLQHILDNAEDPGNAVAEMSSEDSMQIFMAGMDACFDEASLAAIQLAPGTGPQQRGDDPDLDALAEGCQDGHERMCELLYFVSPVGSEYEEIGASCVPPSASTSCSGLPFGTTGIDTASAEVDLLAEDCVDGDMIACDLLFQISDLGSELERLGASCGDRIVQATPDCRTRFGY